MIGDFQSNESLHSYLLADTEIKKREAWRAR